MHQFVADASANDSDVFDEDSWKKMARNKGAKS